MQPHTTTQETITVSAVEIAETGHTDLSRENAETLSRLYDAFAAGDVETAAAFVADDYILHVPGRSNNAGDYWGPEGLRTFMSNVLGYNGGLFDIAVSTFAVSGNDAFTREVIRINNQFDPDREFILKITNQFKIRDGKLVESWVVPENQYVYDDYYSHMPAGGYPPQNQRGRAQNRGAYSESLLDLERATATEATQLLAEMYTRFWRGDGDGMRAVIADDVIVDITHNSAMSGVYHGWDGYMAFRDKLMAMAGDKYKLEVSALAGNDTDVFATEHIRMNRAWDPTVGTLDVVMHFEIHDGKITRMDDFPVDPFAWETFYTPAAS
jgi:ketosteroid isomerase-like protein